MYHTNLVFYLLHMHLAEIDMLIASRHATFLQMLKLWINPGHCKLCWK